MKPKIGLPAIFRAYFRKYILLAFGMKSRLKAIRPRRSKCARQLAQITWWMTKPSIVSRLQQQESRRFCLAGTLGIDLRPCHRVSHAARIGVRFSNTLGKNNAVADCT